MKKPLFLIHIFILLFLAPSPSWAGKDARPCHVIIYLGNRIYLQLPLDNRSVQTIFEAARSRWEKTFDRPFLRHTLADIREGNLTNVSTDAERLKEMRKLGDRLRSAYRVLSKKHDSPKDFKLFIRELGTLNDMIGTLVINDPQEVDVDERVMPDPVKMSRIAASLLGQLSNQTLLETLPPLEVAREASIAEFVQDSLDKIRHLLQDDEGRRLRRMKATQFHRIRKHLKHIRSILNLFREEEHTAGFAQFYQDLQRITKGMGKTNDAIERERYQQRRMKDKTFYERFELDFPKDLSIDILTLIDKFHFIPRRP